MASTDMWKRVKVGEKTVTEPIFEVRIAGSCLIENIREWIDQTRRYSAKAIAAREEGDPTDHPEYEAACEFDNSHGPGADYGRIDEEYFETCMRACFPDLFSKYSFACVTGAMGYGWDDLDELFELEAVMARFDAGDPDAREQLAELLGDGYASSLCVGKTKIDWTI